MKTRWIIVPLLAGFLASNALAQPPMGMSKSHDPEKRLQHLAIELGLTDAQLEQVRAIFKAKHDRAEAIHDRYETPAQKQMRKELKALHEETQTQLSEVLTSEQMAVLKALRPHHRPPRH
ncbi:MAG: hypothetical protein D6698_01085 [Gammaproteobacteria bacterium]|nr:MAG: hypothetical protein D6698_01085 [Gammaproteobacteria bacterium]